MKQISGLIPTYSSDEFGVCSALYELGGLVVMHDASGCNSTYTTHDEPRWYDMDSQIYVSAISEMEAIMGDDQKLMDDITEVAEETHPAFIAVIGAPIPYMTGIDFEAIARLLEERNGVPCFGFSVNGMQPYTLGVSMALRAVVDRFSARTETALSPGNGRSRSGARVNLVGATPLDFAVNGSIQSMREWLTEHGFVPAASISLECSLEDIVSAGEADVSLVLSYGGLAAARRLEEKFGIPYIVGVPIGQAFSELLADQLGTCVETAKSPEKASYADIHGTGPVVAAIGESVFQASLAAAAALEQNADLRVLCPVDTEEFLLRDGDDRTPEEDDILRELQDYEAVVADPMYRVAAPEQAVFYELPHEAFSGRIYDDVNPNLINRTLQSAGFDFSGRTGRRS